MLLTISVGFINNASRGTLSFILLYFFKKNDLNNLKRYLCILDLIKELL